MNKHDKCKVNQRLTDDMINEDNIRFRESNLPFELGYAGRYIWPRKLIMDDDLRFHAWLCRSALALLNEKEKEIKALRLLVEWAEECDFGFDQFPEEYARYKDEIEDMSYLEGMVHIAKRTLEDYGAFKEGGEMG